MTAGELNSAEADAPGYGGGGGSSYGGGGGVCNGKHFFGLHSCACDRHADRPGMQISRWAAARGPPANFPTTLVAPEAEATVVVVAEATAELVAAAVLETGRYDPNAHHAP